MRTRQDRKAINCPIGCPPEPMGQSRGQLGDNLGDNLWDNPTSLHFKRKTCELPTTMENHKRVVFPYANARTPTKPQGNQLSHRLSLRLSHRLSPNCPIEAAPKHALPYRSSNCTHVELCKKQRSVGGDLDGQIATMW